jgi:hypothetical protein
MKAKQTISILIFVSGASLAGLAAIHFVWRYPVIIRPLALPIGMTPLVLLFEYSLSIPGHDFFVGLAFAGVSWFMLRGSPLPSVVWRSVQLVGMSMAGVSVLVFILASAYYNVGMAGPVPSGWYGWVRPGTQFGEIGLVLVLVGAVMKVALPESGTLRTS